MVDAQPPVDDTDESPPATGDHRFILPDRDKLEALAEFAAGAGHEINNPLATIIGRAQLLMKDERDPQRRQMLAAIGAQAYRIRDMIGDTMLFARPPVPERTTVDVAATLNEVLSKLKEELSTNDCSVRQEATESLRVDADSVQLAIVLSELLKNACQAGASQIDVAMSSHPSSVLIRITDNGRGFSDVERRHAFDPFFSGRQAGRGLGFGLSKCWRIIDQHGGSIQIESAPSEKRTTVEIVWPAASGA